MGNAAVKLASKRGTEALGEVPADFFALSALDIAGKALPFSALRDKHRAFLITNVACKCGLTGAQYEQLVALHGEYRQLGLAVLAFPCNQFGGQEPEPEAGIERFVREKFSPEFTLFSKVDVNGPNAHPVFRFLRANSVLGDAQNAGKIPWNFAKFLVDAQGRVIAYAPPTDLPRTLEPQIRELLGMPPSR